MATSFHLRPVSNSPSPSTGTTTSSDRTPPPRHGPSSSASHANLLPPGPSASRRPMSPTSIRDLDLTNPRRDASTRIWPTPPTGHELMALFPPAPPMAITPGSTSGYFHKEERAFFAQAGKEIVRVQIEVDMPSRKGDEDAMMGVSSPAGKAHAPTRQNSSGSRHGSQAWSPHTLHRPPPPPTSATTTGTPTSTASPSTRSSHHHHHHHPSSTSYPHESSRPARQGPIPLTAQPVYPGSGPAPAPNPSSTSQSQPGSQSSNGNGQMPPPPVPSTHTHRPPYPVRSPPVDQQYPHHPHPHHPNPHPHPQPYPHNGTNTDTGRQQRGEEYGGREEMSDEAWRTPMPHNQRRRAGKHTKRVVVK